MKRVLSLATTYPTFIEGDATPPFVHELNKRLVKKGLDIFVLCPRSPGAKKFEIQDGVKIYRYPYFFFSSWETLSDGAILPNLKRNRLLWFQVPFFVIGGFFGLIKIIKKSSIKIIHCHRIITNGFICALYRKFIDRSIKIIVTSHGSDAHLNSGFVGKIAHWMRGYSLNYINGLTVVSSSLKGVFQIYKQTNNILFEIIPMGVDSEKFHPRKYDEEIKKKYEINGAFLIFVGRLTENKGVTYLVDAMSEVLKKLPDAKLLIVGQGPLENQMKKKVSSLGLDNSIIFTGRINNIDLPAFYATSDVLIGPSLYEGFGLVYVEALMSGTPIICTDSHGVRDIIEFNNNGVCIESRSSQAIYQAVVQILCQNCIIGNYRESVLKYDREQVSLKYADLIYNI